MSNSQQDDTNAIHVSHALSGNVDALQEHYADWATNYDRDVADNGYVGAVQTAELLDRYVRRWDSLPEPGEVRVLDAGCGTGLVGQELKDRGFAKVDGFDISAEMVEEAARTGAYNKLLENCDVTERIEELASDAYDAAVSAGVFTLGHVPPTAMNEMARLVRTDGIIVVGTRKSYVEKTNFADYCKTFSKEGKIEVVDVVKAPYIEEEPGEYWVFRAR